MNLLKEPMIIVKKSIYFSMILRNLILSLINLKKKGKKGINKSKELLKSYEVNNNNANTLIKRSKTIIKDDNLNKRGVG